MSTLEWVTELSDEQKPQAAELILEVFPEYYACFGTNSEVLTSAIQKQFSLISELNSFVALAEGSHIMGIACFYKASEADFRRFASTKEMLAVAMNRAEAIQRLRSIAFSNMPTEGTYLARICLRSALRGSGMAHSLLKEVEKQSRGNPLFLHVASENKRALRFYEKEGFDQITQGPYPLLTKEL